LAHNLHICQLTLTDFRNYRTMRMEPAPGLVVLTGSNGAGKTNLLEAVSLLAPGRGLRRAPFSELARAEGDGRWAVAAKTSGPHGDVALGTAWTGNGDDGARQGARQVSIDGDMQSGSGALGPYFNVLWLTPSMDRLFAGPAADRRRFLDRLVMAFDGEHGQRAVGFERLMRERNRLLERTNSDASWLSGVELQMAENAVALAAARCDAVRALDRHMQAEAMPQDALFPWAALCLQGDLERDLDEFSAVEVEDRYRKLLADSRRLDAAAGRTTCGPHRSDLVVTHGPKGIAANRCSTGEQKALLVSTILAHARLIAGLDGGTVPVLLLDEIAAHLDRERRAGLFDVLRSLGTQVWMTGTEAALFDEIQNTADLYRVDSGEVVAQ
jgi:DNA replication and repair protein RecF